MAFPMPPTGLKNNSDLLQRIGNFLPKIEAANEELKDQENVQIDVGLVADDDDDEDDDDECSEPTIQLKVQLGDLEKNKEVFDMLLTKDDDNEAMQTTEGEQPIVSAKEEALTKLLKDDNDEKTTNQTKKVLIQEIK